MSHVFYCSELKSYFMAGDYFRRAHHPRPHVNNTRAPAAAPRLVDGMRRIPRYKMSTQIGLLDIASKSFR